MGVIILLIVAVLFLAVVSYLTNEIKDLQNRVFDLEYDKEGGRRPVAW